MNHIASIGDLTELSPAVEKLLSEELSVELASAEREDSPVLGCDESSEEAITVSDDSVLGGRTSNIHMSFSLATVLQFLFSCDLFFFFFSAFILQEAVDMPSHPSPANIQKRPLVSTHEAEYNLPPGTVLVVPDLFTP
jgi:hypothetical protein